MQHFFILLFSLAFTLFTPDISISEPWNCLNPTPTGENLNDFWGSSESNVFAVGDNGTILHFDGEDWSAMDSNVPYDKCCTQCDPADLTSVWGISANSVYAVGTCGTVMHYDGNTWSRMTAGEFPYEPQGIWGTSDSNIYIVDLGGDIFHYDGNVWRKQVDASGYSRLYDIIGFSENSIFAVGNGDGWILHYDGQSWKKIWFGFSDELQGIWGSSENNLYAISYNKIFHYDGNLWAQVDYDLSGITIKSISGSSANDVYVVSIYNGHIYHFDGNSWTHNQASLIYSGEIFNTVWCSQNGHAFIGGSYGVLLRYDKTDWHRDTNRFILDQTYWTSENFTGLWGMTSNDIFLTFGRYNNSQIVRYRNGTFSKMSTPIKEYLYDIWGSDNNNIFAVGGNGTILYYNGNTWVVQNSGIKNNLNTVWGTSSNNVFAAGDNGTILHYDGTAWSPMTSYTIYKINDIWGSSGTDIYAGGDYKTLLHYDGVKWNLIEGFTYNGSALRAIWGTSANNIYIAGNYSNILHFNGTDWQEMKNLTGISNFYAIWGSSATDIYVSGYDGIIHYDGLGWNNSESYIFEKMDCILGFNANEIFTAGDEGQLFFYGQKPVADFTADQTSGKFPLNVHFTDQSSSNVYKWLWDFGDGETSEEKNPNHIFAVSGQYTVSLTVWNNVGVDIKQKSNYITPIPDPKTITASAGTGGTISPTGNVLVNYGANQAFTITPNTGYSVSVVTVDGAPASPAIPETGGVFTFTNVTANHTISTSFKQKSASSQQFIGIWSDGVYSWNQSTNQWTKMASTSNALMIAAGKVDTDTVDDLIGVWSSGLFVRQSTNAQWIKLSSPPTWVVAGDLNNDGRDDIIGSWTNDGVYSRDSVTGKWTRITTPARQLAAGNIHGDNRDDLVGVWDAGLWVRYSLSASWQKIDATIPVWITTGDMTGSGRTDIIGSYTSGTFYRNSATGTWTKISTPAEQVTSGDIDGDGRDDLIGVWSTGLWVRYGATGKWQQISSSKPKWITTGRIANAALSSESLDDPSESLDDPSESLDDPSESLDDPLESAEDMDILDLSQEGPGGMAAGKNCTTISNPL